MIFIAALCIYTGFFELRNSWHLFLVIHIEYEYLKKLVQKAFTAYAKPSIVLFPARIFLIFLPMQYSIGIVGIFFGLPDNHSLYPFYRCSCNRQRHGSHQLQPQLPTMTNPICTLHHHNPPQQRQQLHGCCSPSTLPHPGMANAYHTSMQLVRIQQIASSWCNQACSCKSINLYTPSHHTHSPGTVTTTVIAVPPHLNTSTAMTKVTHTHLDATA